jgi:hypothetical protein
MTGPEDLSESKGSFDFALPLCGISPLRMTIHKKDPHKQQKLVWGTRIYVIAAFDLRV